MDGEDVEPVDEDVFGGRSPPRQLSAEDTPGELADLAPPPPSQHPPLEGTNVFFKPAYVLDEDLLDEHVLKLHDIDQVIQTNIDRMEKCDISTQIIEYKTYEVTHEFKKKIDDVREEKDKLLRSLETRSEVSLILNDLEGKIQQMEKEMHDRVSALNIQKISFQEQTQEAMTELDQDLLLMDQCLEAFSTQLEIDKPNLYKAQVILLNQKYVPSLERYRKNYAEYAKLQWSGWKLNSSEIKLNEILDQCGLKFTPSNRLLTRSGSLLTFEEALERNYFDGTDMPVEKIMKFLKEDLIIDTKISVCDTISTADTMASKFVSEDVKYLKQYVGKPLTLALAEITMKHPNDPVHYLAHYLFKYRYNQDLEKIQKKEIDELTEERQTMAQSRWKAFVEHEARNAVLEMVLKAEQIAIENELKRIELQQKLAAEEEEEEGLYNTDPMQ